MKVYNNIDDVNISERTAVAMGYFDGMHLGHQALIRMTVQTAITSGLKSVVFTFRDNPKNLLSSNSAVKSILSHEDKARLMDTAGIDYMISVPFDDRIRNLAPRQYIRLLLDKNINMTAVCCGFNYRFGKDAAGDKELLQAMGAAEGFEVSIVKPYTIDGNVVSSSLIRNLISDGDMAACKTFLGRYYTASGKVVSGNRLGRTIGFPTVNIMIDEDMLTPPHGVYVTACHIGDQTYRGVTNVGIKPTIGDGKKSVETHLFDVDQDLYEKRIIVEFFKMIREERRFENLDALAVQIEKDCRIARAYHSNL